MISNTSLVSTSPYETVLFSAEKALNEGKPALVFKILSDKDNDHVPYLLRRVMRVRLKKMEDTVLSIRNPIIVQGTLDELMNICQKVHETWTVAAKVAVDDSKKFYADIRPTSAKARVLTSRTFLSQILSFIDPYRSQAVQVMRKIGRKREGWIESMSDRHELISRSFFSASHYLATHYGLERLTHKDLLIEREEIDKSRIAKMLASRPKPNILQVEMGNFYRAHDLFNTLCLHSSNITKLEVSFQSEGDYKMFKGHVFPKLTCLSVLQHSYSNAWISMQPKSEAILVAMSECAPNSKKLVCGDNWQLTLPFFMKLPTLFPHLIKFESESPHIVNSPEKYQHVLMGVFYFQRLTEIAQHYQAAFSESGPARNALLKQARAAYIRLDEFGTNLLEALHFHAYLYYSSGHYKQKSVAFDVPPFKKGDECFFGRSENDKNKEDCVRLPPEHIVDIITRMQLDLLLCFGMKMCHCRSKENVLPEFDKLVQTATPAVQGLWKEIQAKVVEKAPKSKGYDAAMETFLADIRKAEKFDTGDVVIKQ